MRGTCRTMFHCRRCCSTKIHKVSKSSEPVNRKHHERWGTRAKRETLQAASRRRSCRRSRRMTLEPRLESRRSRARLGPPSLSAEILQKPSGLEPLAKQLPFGDSLTTAGQAPRRQGSHASSGCLLLALEPMTAACYGVCSSAISIDMLPQCCLRQHLGPLSLSRTTPQVPRP